MIGLQQRDAGRRRFQHRKAHQRDVQGVRIQAAQQVHRGGLLDDQVHARVVLAERRQQLRHQRVDRRADKAHLEHALLAAGAFLGSALDFIGVEQRGARIAQYHLGRRRGLQARGQPLEQLYAQFLFQFLDRGGKGRLRHMKPLGRPMEIERFGQDQQLLELA